MPEPEARRSPAHGRSPARSSRCRWKANWATSRNRTASPRSAGNTKPKRGRSCSSSNVAARNCRRGCRRAPPAGEVPTVPTPEVTGHAVCAERETVPTAVTIEGAFISPIRKPVDRMAEEYSLHTIAAGGKQSPESFEGGAKASLTVNIVESKLSKPRPKRSGSTQKKKNSPSPKTSSSKQSRSREFQLVATVVVGSCFRSKQFLSVAVSGAGLHPLRPVPFLRPAGTPQDAGGLTVLRRR